jgi:hypothetical protein
MKKFLCVMLLFSGLDAFSQKKVFRNPNDTTQNCYQIFLPKTPVKGLIVVAYNNFVKPELATEQGLAIVSVYPSSEYLNTLFDTAVITLLDEMIVEICDAYQIPKSKVVVGGLSAGGTFAVRYAAYCFQNGSKNSIKPAAIFAIDPPLDYERFWYECSRKVKLNFHEAAVAEGKMVLDWMQTKLGGTPEKMTENYHKIAPYSRNAPNGGQIQYLKNLPIRLYHEPDVNWWIKNRRQDYASMNSIDCAGAINELQIQGNTKAELITTYNKGYREDGMRHPHSWSILDEKELVQWCLGIIK